MRKFAIALLIIPFAVGCDSNPKATATGENVAGEEAFEAREEIVEEMNQSEAAEVYDEAMRVHNELMPRMVVLREAHGRLRLALRNNAFADPEKAALARRTIDRLSAAQDSMATWMAAAHEPMGAQVEMVEGDLNPSVSDDTADGQLLHEEVASPGSFSQGNDLSFQKTMRSRIEALRAEVDDAYAQAEELLEEAAD